MIFNTMKFSQYTWNLYRNSPEAGMKRGSLLNGITTKDTRG